jgi:hypothetical protein
MMTDIEQYGFKFTEHEFCSLNNTIKSSFNNIFLLNDDLSNTILIDMIIDDSIINYTIDNTKHNIVDYTVDNTIDNTIDNTNNNTKHNIVEYTVDNTKHNIVEYTVDNTVDNTKNNIVKDTVDNTKNNIVENSIDDIRLRNNQQFLIKLYDILNIPKYSDIIKWSDCGLYIHIYDKHKLGTDVLPNHFHTNRYQTFIRQLNYFYFSKVRITSTNTLTVYYHAQFTKINNNINLPRKTSSIIKRKKNLNTIKSKKRCKSI